MPTPSLTLMSISPFYFRRMPLPVSATYQVLLELLAGGGAFEGAQKPREMTLLLCMCPIVDWLVCLAGGGEWAGGHGAEEGQLLWGDRAAAHLPAHSVHPRHL